MTASNQNRPATLLVEILAVMADLGLAACVFLAAIRLLDVGSLAWVLWLALFIAFFLISWFAQKRFLSRTWGEWIWKLRAGEHDSRLYQEDEMTIPVGLIGIFLTLSTWTAAFGTLYGRYADQPQWRQSEKWMIAPYFPKSDWMVAPFFYSLGGWPKTLHGHPIFYSLPYEKGPPQRFLGHIVARWSIPDIQLTYEGPKTPSSSPTREAVQNCFLPERTGSIFERLGCLRTRELALSRHLEEMRNIQPTAWKIRWFMVDNPALPQDERAQGIFLEASNDRVFQSRFILITPNGTHQAVILEAPQNADGQEAAQVLESAIGSLRISDDLNPGRAWIDKQLEGIQLNQNPLSGSPETVVSRLAEVQALLVSKLSVEPKLFDPYYHLAGTSLLLLRYSVERHQSDWAITAKPMIQSAYRYAQDVAPKDARLLKLRDLWFDSQKY